MNFIILGHIKSNMEKFKTEGRKMEGNNERTCFSFAVDEIQECELHENNTNNR